MTTASASGQPIALRRHEVERRIAASRATIGAAWADFEFAEGRVETNLRRAIGWTRRASSIAVSMAALCTFGRTFRRVYQAAPAGAAAGLLGKAVSAVATWRSLRRLLVRLRQARAQRAF